MAQGIIDWKEESKRFNQVAELYDEYRPTYPDEMIQTILADVPPQAHILEIGCGTGKATTLFAKQGHAMLCIEPGESLIAVAQRNLQAYPRVQFEMARFENWQLRESEFDLVISAQAFHWVPQDVGYAKAAAALNENGRLALFWNMYPYPQGGIFDDLNRVYQECVPELAAEPTSYEGLLQQREQDIRESGLFASISVSQYPWSQTYTSAQYLGLLNTYSDHLRLPEERRAHLFNDVATVIDKHGGLIEKPYLGVLYTAVKK